MKNLEYILELMTKDGLSASEREVLERILKSDPEARIFFETYNKAEPLIKNSGHISSQLLDEYVLFKNGNREGQNGIVAQVPYIEKHLRECSKCSQEFLFLNSEYNEVDNFVSESLSAETDTSKKTTDTFLRQTAQTSISEKARSRIFSSGRFYYAKFAISVLFLFGVVYSGLYMVSSASTPDEQKYASIDNKADFYITRGRATNDFQKSILAIQNNDYESAIRFLKDDIQSNQSDETIFYTYYVLGLTYLESSGSDFLGLFPSYNKNKIQSGINYLEECIRRNNSGKYPNINYDSYYFIGKAYLMINNPAAAAKYFQLVVSNKGSKLEESEEILKHIGTRE